MGARPALSGDARLPAVSANEPAGSRLQGGKARVTQCFLAEPGPLMVARARLVGPSGIWGLISVIEEKVWGNDVWGGTVSAVVGESEQSFFR